MKTSLEILLQTGETENTASQHGAENYNQKKDRKPDGRTSESYFLSKHCDKLKLIFKYSKTHTVSLSGLLSAILGKAICNTTETMSTFTASLML